MWILAFLYLYDNISAYISRVVVFNDASFNTITCVNQILANDTEIIELTVRQDTSFNSLNDISLNGNVNIQVDLDLESYVRSNDYTHT